MMLRSLLLTASAALALGACQEGASTEPTASTAVAAAAASGDPATATVKTATRKFRDWLVVCDNGNACSAFGPTPDGQGGWVRVSMNAGPDARPAVSAGFWGDQEDGGGGPFTLTIDGRAFPAAQGIDPSNDQAYAGVIEGDALPVVDALASGRRLTLSQGVESTPISLSGAAAALLWIDERQGRLSTTTALVRRGSKPASTVPAAPALPVVRPAPAVAQTNLPKPVLPAAFEARADVRKCRADTVQSPTFQTAVTVDRLSADQELWGVPCSSGAYNYSMRYFVTGPNGADPQALSFPTSRTPDDEVVDSEYDPGSRTLRGFNKGRGIGDCGIDSLWVWTGRAFALQAESEMRECWGVPSDQWPTTWRSR
ncbi:hypothetical protein D3C87_503210 [compost metagenome]